MESEIMEYTGTGSKLTVQAVREQVNDIQLLMKEVMHEGEHYGVIPGTNGKPSLLKAGAEKLGFMFRLIPDLEVTEKPHENGHVEFIIKCRLINIETGKCVGSGVGSASTLETKYRYRNASRKCPQCGAEAIIKGKTEYGGGWVCFKNKGGCGAKFTDNDPGIMVQEVGKVENPDIADCYNTVLKMAKKRAHIDAMLTATAASDIFTQDIEDFGGSDPQTEYIPPETHGAPVKDPAPHQSAAQKPAPTPQGEKHVLAEGEVVPPWFMALPGVEKMKWAPRGFSISGGKICVRKAS